MNPVAKVCVPFLTIAALLFNGCATNPVTGKKNLVLISEDQEIQMGKEADPAIVSEFGVYPDEKLQAYFDAKGQEMARICHRPTLKYEFKIMDSPVVNAFAIPLRLCAGNTLLGRRFGLRWGQFTLTATDANRFAIRLARHIRTSPA